MQLHDESRSGHQATIASGCRRGSSATTASSAPAGLASRGGGALRLHRSPSGVTLTGAGTALCDEARTVLEQAERARARVAAAAGTATFTIGILADSAEEPGTSLAAAFRHRHPAVRVHVREADLSDPTAGLRAGLVDVALTRTPFDRTGISIRVLRSDPVGVVLRADDPLAGRSF